MKTTVVVAGIAICLPVAAMHAAEPATGSTPATQLQCPARDVHVTGLRSAGRAIAVYDGLPGKALRLALRADWKALSPDDKPLPVTGCLGDGYIRLKLEHIEACRTQGCWIASRWVATDRPLHAASADQCQQIPSESVAASRDGNPKCLPGSR